MSASSSLARSSSNKTLRKNLQSKTAPRNSLSMAHIQVLPSAVVVRIAAGEVIERPSCIVKELLENALDAGATSVQLSISEGGTSFIELRDNGQGIPADELELALTPHATSKLKEEQDLWTLHTRGFRGEALASIASVSHVELMSRTRDASEGYRIISEGGQITLKEPCAMEVGTIFRCKHLFYNTPVRKKFLKSAATEKGHIDRILRRLAISDPKLGISFFSDSEQIYNFPSTSNVFNRIQQLFGKDVSSQLKSFEAHEKRISIYGFVSTGEFRDGTASDVWIFVNDRPIQDRTILAAVTEGYRTALMQGRYPLTFIHVQCPPEMVDVNIHPRKNEVRFTQSQTIFKMISQAVAKSLAKQADEDMSLRLDTTYQFPYRPSPSTFSTFQNLSYATPASTTHTELFPAQVSSPQYTLPAEHIAPSIQYLGQLDQTYLLVKTSQTLMVIDQHAAHERILFEQFRKQFSEGKSQNLLIPEILELSFEEEQSFQNSYAFLEKAGFSFEPFGTRTYRVLSTPFLLKPHQIKSLILKIIKDPLDSPQKMSWENWIDDICASLACHAAVRAHDPLTSEEIQSMLFELQSTHMSSYCPHGRPSWLELSIEDLEKMFKRVV